MAGLGTAAAMTLAPVGAGVLEVGQAAAVTVVTATLSWTPSTAKSYAFGTTVAVGTTLTQAFTLTNSGERATGTITSVTITGSGAFSVVTQDCTGTSLAPMGPHNSCSVTVQFAPTTAGQTYQATLVVTAAQSSATLALSGASPSAGGHLYWSTFFHGTIVEAGLTGTTPHPIVAGQSYPTGVAVGGTHLYWADTHSGKIMEAGLTGTAPTVIASGQTEPKGVAVGGGHVYWADSTSGTIVEADLTGATRQVIASGQYQPMGVAVAGTHLYWATYGSNKIVEASLTGTIQRTIGTGSAGPFELAVGGTHLYWTNGSNQIVEADLTGATQHLLIGSPGLKTGVAVGGTHLYWATFAPPAQSSRPASQAQTSTQSSPAHSHTCGGWRSARSRT